MLELRDVLEVLDPKQKGPRDLEEKSLFLASEIFELSGKTKKGKGRELAEEILYSGKAFKKFEDIIKAQKGKLIELKLPKNKKEILAKKSGRVIEIHNKKINSLARVTGCPADRYSGLYIFKKVGDRVKKGEKILTIYTESRPRLREAIRFYERIKPIKIK